MPILGVIVCLVVATAYCFVWPGRNDPKRVQERPLWANLILRWFHSLAWVLLAMACYLRSSLPAALAGGVYLIFLLTLAYERKLARSKFPPSAG